MTRFRFEALPSEVFHAIISFAASEPGLDVEGDVTLVHLASVCRLWRSTVHDFSAVALLEGIRFTLSLMRRDEVLSLRRAVTLLNGHLREIVIQVNPSTKKFERGAELQWPALFSLATQLRMLFVSDMPTSYSTGIVGTAIMYCGALTTIDVSGNFIHDRTTDSSIPEALQPALKKHQQGGLEVFNAAFVAETDRYARSTAYINSLCDSCPKIQVLNGWNSVSDILQADEQWIIDEITWERFCRICTDLRSFNWQVVPFSTNFLEVFAKFPKPRLEELSLATSARWDWNQYFEETKTTPSIEHGPSVKCASMVFAACPSLRLLQIDVRHQLDNNRGQALFDIDQEIFGDEFCEELVRCCPELQVLTIIRPNPSDSIDSPIMSFTDKSLQALARLPYLQKLNLKPTNITGMGIFSLVENAKVCLSAQRNFTIVVGATDGPNEKHFYSVLEQFLTMLEASATLSFLNQPLALQLLNRCAIQRDPPTVNREWSRTYTNAVYNLVQSTRRVLPSLHVHIICEGWDRDMGFARIPEMIFRTQSAEVPPDMELLSGDRPVDFDGLLIHRTKHTQYGVTRL